MRIWSSGSVGVMIVFIIVGIIIVTGMTVIFVIMVLVLGARVVAVVCVVGVIFVVIAVGLVKLLLTVSVNYYIVFHCKSVFLCQWSNLILQLSILEITKLVIPK